MHISALVFVLFLVSASAFAKGPTAVAHGAVMAGHAAEGINEAFENTGREWCITPGFEPRSASDFSVQNCPPENEKPHRH